MARRPTWGLVMIVKDGLKDDLRSCLTSLRPVVGWWTVVDTGSTDGSQDVVREIMAGVPGELHEEPFENFGSARSRAFAHAHGHADWLFATDADMTWTVEPGYVPDPANDAYLVEMGNGGPFRWKLPLILRGTVAWKSVGAVHEYTARADDSGYVTGDAHPHVTITYPERADAAKPLWQLSMLDEEYAKDPDNPRTVFYRAQCLREVGRYAESREMYLKRATQGGYDSEVYYANFQAATLIAEWPERFVELLKVWEYRPHRLEALAMVCRDLNARDQHRTVWALTSSVYVDGTIPPTTDVGFVHYNCWDWNIPFERSIAAWYVGEFTEGRRLCERLLADPALPPDMRTQVAANLALFPPEVA